MGIYIFGEIQKFFKMERNAKREEEGIKKDKRKKNSFIKKTISTLFLNFENTSLNLLMNVTRGKLFSI